MKKSLMITLIAACLVLTGRAVSFASAFTMARLQSVSTDGPYDAARNPALLALQRKNNAIGLIMQYTPLQTDRESFGLKQYPLAGTLSQGINGFRSGSVYLSYAGRVSAGAIGLAIDSDDKYQASYERYERRYLQFDINSAVISQMRIEGRRFTAAPRFQISYGGIVDGNHALGVRFAAGYRMINDEFTAVGSSGLALSQKHRAYKKTEAVTSELSVGYTYTEAGSQAGLMLRSGRFTWVKQRMYYTHILPSALQYFAGSFSEPYSFQYDKGFSIVAGGYHKLASFAAVAFEGEYEIPFSNADKDLRFDEFTNFFGYSVNTAVNKKGTFAIRAGLEFLPSGPVTINLGGGASTTREKRSARYLSQTNTTDIFSGHFGLDFLLAEGFIMTVGSWLEYTWIRSSQASNNYFNSITAGGRTELYTLNAHLGISCNF